MSKIIIICDNLDDYKAYVRWLNEEGVDFQTFDKTIILDIDKESVAGMLVSITRDDLEKGFDIWLRLLKSS